MKIILAKSAGFCFGVERALKIVEEESKKGKVNVLGSLIHNEYVVNDLKKKRVKSVESVDDANGKIVISAHGVADSVKEQVKEKCKEVIDATCPLVKQVHKCAKDIERTGKHVVVIGQQNHTEVRGIVGNLKNYTVIENFADIEKLKDKKVGVVVQTTQNVEEVKKIVEKISEITEEMKHYDTICFATKERQKEADEISRKVDLMIVIGSKQSGNTKRLFEVCSGNTETKYIQSYRDLKKEWFDGKDKIGVTAGASTPKVLIDEVFDTINKM